MQSPASVAQGTAGSGFVGWSLLIDCRYKIHSDGTTYCGPSACIPLLKACSLCNLSDHHQVGALDKLGCSTSVVTKFQWCFSTSTHTSARGSIREQFRTNLKILWVKKINMAKANTRLFAKGKKKEKSFELERNTCRPRVARMQSQKSWQTLSVPDRHVLPEVPPTDGNGA